MLNKRLLAVIILSLATSLSWAHQADEPVLNKVSIQLQAEKWIETQTALVTVSVNAALSDQNLLKMQNEIMLQLKQLAQSDDWRIVSLNRRQDSSGLESVQISAQARLSQANLAGIRQKAKDLTKPGKTFKVSDISFHASDAERRAANTAMREDIYQQAKQEAARLNAAYSTQHYFIHQIDFMGFPGIIQASSRTMMMAKGADMSVENNISVDNKATINARVVLASVVEQKTNNHA